jgi:hypothetical protein
MKKPTYPRIDPKFDRRRKLQPEDYERIVVAYKSGTRKAELARTFNVSITSITRVVDPARRELENKIKNEWNKAHRAHVREIKNGSDSRRYLRSFKNVREYESARHHYRMKTDPEFNSRQRLSDKESKKRKQK